MQSERKKGVDSDRGGEGRGGCERDCISSLRSGRPNRECQVFVVQGRMVCFTLTAPSEWQTPRPGHRNMAAA